ncbi:MAG: single-stranded DNA-binding protein [Fimbriimonas sp.]
MLNRVVLIGRLTRDPELRTTPNGKNVAKFGLAVNKKFKPQDGSPDADFFNITAWGQTADFVSNYLTKGRMVAVEGRIETRKYTDSNGVNREAFDIVVDNVQSLDRPRDEQAGGNVAGGGRAPSPVNAAADEYDPFADGAQ